MKHRPQGHRERLAYLVALGVFLATLFWGWRTRPTTELHLSWLALTLAAAPFSLLLNALEYRLAGTMISRTPSLGRSFRVSVLGSAANLLPLPGAILVRTAALRQEGAGYRSALGVTGAIGVGWLGVSAATAGVLLLTAGSTPLGAILSLAGAAALSGMVWLIRSTGYPIRIAGVRILLLELVFVVVAALRMYGALRALGIEAGPEQIVTLVVAAPLAGAAGIFPGGLGLREILAAGLAQLVALHPASGSLAAGLDRIVGLSVLALATVGLMGAVARTGDPSR